MRGRTRRRERGGALAKTVVHGLGVGAVWKALSWIIQLFPTASATQLSRTSVFPNATLNLDISRGHGVGYVMAREARGVMLPRRALVARPAPCSPSWATT